MSVFMNLSEFQCGCYYHLIPNHNLPLHVIPKVVAGSLILILMTLLLTHLSSSSFSSLCVLSLHAALRCCLRSIQQHDPKPDPEPEASQPDDPPTLVYSSGLDLAGNEVECIICLSEFQDGDTLRVLDSCKHGFHVQCIQKWVSSSHSSCPTCRTSIFSSPTQLHSQSLPISSNP